ncbi:MAG: four helix bundle protein [Nitrospirae bacterium]|nr:four helix bundle protein [Nitrospirota bacterium]
MAGKHFEDLEVWKLSRQLTRELYEITSNEFFSKDYGLLNQIRRASVSIMSNIAEGFERGGNKEFIQMLYIAKGSCGEVRSQLYIALDQNYITSDRHKNLIEKSKTISIKLNNFIAALKNSNFSGYKYKHN